MPQIAIIGTGYVGLVTGACLAELGNHVACFDIEPSRIDLLEGGIVPFFEPGLEHLILQNRRLGRLTFARNVRGALLGSEIVFITVGTPCRSDGQADLSQTRSAAFEVARHLSCPTIVVNKSTVPVHTGDLLRTIIREHQGRPERVSVISNPEFLREGSAINDFMHPDRIIIGADDDEQAVDVMRKLYAPLQAPIIVTDVHTAEMIKYVANAFLATKISFINEIANVCEGFGVDFDDLVLGVGSDKRIGTACLEAGLGFGGSCLPKDVRILRGMAEAVGVRPTMLAAASRVNQRQIRRSVERIQSMVGSLQGARAAVLGLSFKAATDDVRESSAIALAQALVARGAEVTAHDPVAIPNAQRLCGSTMRYADSPYETARNADVAIVATAWEHYKRIDLMELKKGMRHARLFDARNAFDPETVRSAGFVYAGAGRSSIDSTDMLVEDRARLFVH